MLITDKETLAHMQKGAELAHKAADRMADPKSTDDLRQIAYILRLLATGIDAIVLTEDITQ